MIRVTVELVSAVTGKTTELARMHIINNGAGDNSIGHYDGITFRGRSKKQLDKLTAMHTARVFNWPRQRLHVWNLVAKMLKELGYTKDQYG